jgi:hypothetical protein
MRKEGRDLDMAELSFMEEDATDADADAGCGVVLVEE